MLNTILLIVQLMHSWDTFVWACAPGIGLGTLCMNMCTERSTSQGIACCRRLTEGPCDKHLTSIHVTEVQKSDKHLP